MKNSLTRESAAIIARYVLPIYFPFLFISLGRGIVVPVTPLFARDLEATLAMTGLIVSAHGIGGLLFDIPTGLFLTRFGDRATIFTAIALTAAASLLLGVFPGVPVMILAMGLMGGGMTLHTMAIQSFVKRTASVERRGRILSMVGGTIRLGMFIGPILGGFLAEYLGFSAVYIAHALLLAVPLTVLLLTPRAFQIGPAAHDVKVRGDGRGDGDGGRHVERDRGRQEEGKQEGETLLTLGGTIFRQWKVLLSAGFVVISLQILRSAREILLPLWGEHMGLGVAQIGLAIGIASAVEMPMFIPVGMVMDKKGRKWTLVPCLILFSLGILLLPLTSAFFLFLLVGILIAFGNGLGSGIVLTLGTDLSPRKGTGHFLGVWRLIGDAGRAVGPLIVGAVAGAVGLFFAPLAIAGLGFSGAVVMIFGVRETLKKREV